MFGFFKIYFLLIYSFKFEDMPYRQTDLWIRGEEHFISQKAIICWISLNQCIPLQTPFQLPLMHYQFISNLNKYELKEPILIFWILLSLGFYGYLLHQTRRLFTSIRFVLWLICNLAFIITEKFVKYISWSHLLLGEYTVLHGLLCLGSIISLLNNRQAQVLSSSWALLYHH